MTSSLDTILSGQGETAPAPEKETTVTQATEAPASESTEQPIGEAPEGGSKTVPIEALHAERQKTKRYTEQIADFDRKLTESNTAWERRISQLLERVNPPQPQEKPDFFQDPDAAIRAALSPVIQHVSQQSEAVSRRFAVSEHGAETVQAAYGEMESRVRSGADRGDYARIMQSGDPWGELVKWHKKETALAEFNGDPVSYRDKMKAEILAELEGKANGGQPAGKPVMPSNLASARNVGARSGPAWSGPTPLTDIFKR